MSSIPSLTVSAAGLTSIGGSRNSENQDAFLISDRLFCVADGHGASGKAIAELVCATAARGGDTDFLELFAAFDAGTRAIVGEGATKTSAGGSTASVLKIAADGACHLAHVGDSEVIVFDSDEADGESLTRDHSALSLPEFHRVRASHGKAKFAFYGPGGSVSRQVFVQTAPDEWSMNPLGGFSYCNVRSDWSSYVLNEYNDRLGMTRAIGDYHMTAAGVISTPVVVSAVPFKGVRAIVMASDGLWDTMQYSEVRAIVRNPECLGNAELATKQLMDIALLKGEGLFGDHTDNITAVVIYVTV